MGSRLLGKLEKALRQSGRRAKTGERIDLVKTKKKKKKRKK